MKDRHYNARAIETKWQVRWENERAYRAESHPKGPTYFVLVFPPYPNGQIHMGHVRNYTIGDVVARYERMTGRSVLHPIGFDAFGLPNEIEATRQAIEPEQLTRRNIKTMARQLRRLGFSYDWSKAIVTIEPEYYRWSQWLFLVLMEQGLVYRKTARVQWCPSCRTSLANEQVREERCWRCAAEVVPRHLQQWFFRLRTYAEEMWSETGRGVYPDNVAMMLRNWLGKTEGAELRFPVQASDRTISVFTTKPELAYGATYLALSPDHPLAGKLVSDGRLEAEAEQLRRRVRESANPARLTDGLDTGGKALHPLTGQQIPIWLAAYVDPDVATGAVMGNPCHDRSDHAFGRAHGLPGTVVVSPDGAKWDHMHHGPYVGEGLLVGCGAFSGRPALEARQDVIAAWEARGVGRRATVFKIRDWLVSRQRGWGTPVPVVHCPACGEVAVTREDLPVRLPAHLFDTGEGNPLSRRPDFLSCRCPDCRGEARRETDTLDTFLDTAWYYLRCTNPDYRQSLCDPEAIARWGRADLYVGGIEIAVPIMLYGSFVAKGLRDAGYVDFAVPCRRLLAHDMVLNRGRKMSKSLGNTVDPESLVQKFGADAVRLLILSLAPPLKKIEWDESRLQGCHNFLRRVWDLGIRQAARARGMSEGESDPRAPAESRLRRLTNEVIRAVTRDMERFQFNTCVTTLIKFLHSLEEVENQPCSGGTILAERTGYHEAVCVMLALLSPIAPHLCEEIRQRLGEPVSLRAVRWPSCDAGLPSRATTRITVKVNARPVVRFEIAADSTQQEVMALARAHQAVRERIGAGRITKEVYVPGQIINFVTS